MTMTNIRRFVLAAQDLNVQDNLHTNYRIVYFVPPKHWKLNVTLNFEGNACIHSFTHGTLTDVLQPWMVSSQ